MIKATIAEITNEMIRVEFIKDGRYWYVYFTPETLLVTKSGETLFKKDI